ncbi:MAG: hypothetical protein P8Y70_17175 [Candidatus Lokiarchaeota archaeon]
MPNTDQDDSKLLLELVACSKCGNPFMKNPDEDEDICENCIKLDIRKRELQLGVFDKVIEVENKMEDSINEMKNQLTLAKGKFNKEFFIDKIKKRSEALKESIDLIEKIEESNDEEYIEQYKDLFEKMKRNIS